MVQMSVRFIGPPFVAGSLVTGKARSPLTSGRGYRSPRHSYISSSYSLGCNVHRTIGERSGNVRWRLHKAPPVRVGWDRQSQGRRSEREPGTRRPRLCSRRAQVDDGAL